MSNTVKKIISIMLVAVVLTVTGLSCFATSGEGTGGSDGGLLSEIGNFIWDKAIDVCNQYRENLRYQNEVVVAESQIALNDAARRYYESQTPVSGQYGNMYYSGNANGSIYLDTENSVLNYPNGSANITHLYYDYSDDSTYMVTNNEYRYFVTYAPTYTNITYLPLNDTNMDNATCNTYFYKLPDGRNSFNLTAEDVMGMVLEYNVVNYSQVSESEHTKALYHFDNDLYDSSSNYSTFVWGSGASTSYMSGGFDKCLYLNDDTHNFTVGINEDIGTGDYTLEWRMYQAMAQKYTNMGYSSTPVIEPLFRYTLTPKYQKGMESCEYCGNTLLDMVNTYNSTYYTSYESSNGNWNVGAYCTSSFSDIHSTQIHYCTQGHTCRTSFQITGKEDISYTSKYKVTPYNSYWLYGNNIESLNSDKFVNSLSQMYGAASSYVLSINNNTSIFNSCYEVSLSGGVATSIGRYKYFDSGESLGGNGEWVSYAISRTNGTTRYFVNGLCVKTVNNDNRNLGRSFVFSIPSDNVQYMYLDELRVSDIGLYESNYNPRTSAFDTNSVLVVPNNPVENMIAIQSAVLVSNVRIGGARITYPQNGYVYIYLNGDYEVTAIQQYNGTDWVSVNASIYNGATWSNLMGYDYSSVVMSSNMFEDNGFGEEIGGVDTPTPPDNPDNPDNPDTPDTPSNPDSGSFGGFLNNIINSFSNILGTLSGIVTVAFEAIGQINATEFLASFRQLFTQEDLYLIFSESGGDIWRYQ